MRGGFQELFRRFCMDGTISGLKYLYLYPGRISRCYWLLCIGMSIYFACLLSVLLYLRFEAMPTRISIENQFEPVPDLPFASITVCSPSQVTTSAVRHFEKTFVDGNRSLDLGSALAQLIGFYQAGQVNEEYLAPLQSLIDINRYTIPEVMTALPQSCDRYLKLCFLGRRRYPGCKGLFRPILTQHGLCCIFNNMYHYQRSGSFVRNERDEKFTPRLVERWGLAHGLSVVVDFEPDEAVDGGVTYAGASQVMFTDWTEFPSNDETTLVPPHVEAFHFIRATYTYCSSDVKDLSTSSRKCYFEDEHRLPFFNRYHNSDCDLMCLVHAVDQHCGCLMFYVPRVYLLRACNVTTLPCVMNVMRRIKDMAEDCDCPRDCESRVYNVDVSLGNLHGLQHMMEPYYADINFTGTTSIMHFFFPHAAYVKQKQETVMSLTTLASNLGGVYGLCVGCSVTSVLEIAFYVRAWVINAVRGRFHRAWHRRVGFHH